MKRIFLTVLLFTAASILFIVPPTVAGQNMKVVESQQDEEKQILRALLEEVRQLRLELRRANLISITLERIRLHEARVESLTQSLQTSRSRLIEMRETYSKLENQIRDAEESKRREPSADLQGMFEYQINEMKSRLSILAREEEQNRNREAELESGLRAAQARLSELNNQLDNMMRQMETP